MPQITVNAVTSVYMNYLFERQNIVLKFERLPLMSSASLRATLPSNIAVNYACLYKREKRRKPCSLTKMSKQCRVISKNARKRVCNDLRYDYVQSAARDCKHS